MNQKLRIEIDQDLRSLIIGSFVFRIDNAMNVNIFEQTLSKVSLRVRFLKYLKNSQKKLEFQ